MTDAIVCATFEEIQRCHNNHSLDNPYAMFAENKNSDHLLIVFGSYDGNFSTTKTTTSIKANGLNIRSNPGTWFLEPLPFGETPMHAALNINEFVKQRDWIKTITVAGFSMGAFAALLYGTWLNCTKIVANAPQIKAPFKHGTIEVNPSRDADIEVFRNVKDVWLKHGVPSMPVVMQCCDKINTDEVWRDVEESKELLIAPNIQLRAYDCLGHMGISKMFLDNLPEYEKVFLP